MKTLVTLSHLLILLIGLATANGQGTFIFDQQTSDENHLHEGVVPIGASPRLFPIQSFTPSLDSVGFVMLYSQGLAAVGMTVNLRANAPDGPVLGTTAPITTPGTYYGVVNLRFDTPVSVTPGTVYFFEAALEAGGGQLNGSLSYLYPGGMLYFSDGTVNPDYDMWFREGVVVPEPSTAALLILAAPLILLRRAGKF